MGKRKATQNKPRLTKKQYQDIQMKQLAKKISDHQKQVQEKAKKEMEERKTKSLSKQELQRLKKEKKEALRQYTLKKAQLQHQRNKQAKEEWQRIQDQLKEEVFADETQEKKKNQEALQRMESYGWKVRSDFEADSDLVGTSRTERQEKMNRLKEVADKKLDYLQKKDTNEEEAGEDDGYDGDDFEDEDADDGLEDALMGGDEDDDEDSSGSDSD